MTITFSETINIIAQKIKNSGVASNVPGKSDPVEHEIAYSIVEINESCEKLMGIYRELLGGGAEDETSLLESYREELRHIYYHIYDCNYFSGVINTIP
jgi:hypothetical protein